MRCAARASAAPWSPSSRTSRWCAPRASRRCPTSSPPSPSARRSPARRAASSPSISGIIDPLFLDFYYMQTFLIIVIIGGAGSFWGVIVAGIALSALPEVLRFSADFRMIIYGVILVVAMFVMPSGVAGWLRERQLARMREAAAMSAILQVTDLRKSYAGVHALDGVSFAVEAGSITGLIGPNGSGKSTAIDCISGFQKLDGGKVVLAGNDITGQAAHHIARAGLMRTFQTVRIYERLEPARQSRDRRPAVRSGHLGRRVPPHPALSRRRRRIRGARARAGRADRPAALLRDRDRHPVLRPEEAGGARRRADAASQDRRARRAGGRRQSEPHPRDRGGAAAAQPRRRDLPDRRAQCRVHHQPLPPGDRARPGPASWPKAPPPRSTPIRACSKPISA